MTDEQDAANAARLARLPRWARQHIDVLEKDLEYVHKTLRGVLPGDGEDSPVKLRMRGVGDNEPVNIP